MLVLPSFAERIFWYEYGRESCMQISCERIFQLDRCLAGIVAPGICTTVEADARQMM